MEDILTVAGSQLVERDPDPTQALLLEAFVAARRDPQVADLLRRRIQRPAGPPHDIIEAAKAERRHRRRARHRRARHLLPRRRLRLPALRGARPAPPGARRLGAAHRPPRRRHRRRVDRISSHETSAYRTTRQGGKLTWPPTQRSSAATTSTTSTPSSRSPTPTCDEAIHTVKDNADAIFTWDYEKGKRPALNKLYEKAKTSQWNGETDLDWSTSRSTRRSSPGRSWPSNEAGRAEAGIDLSRHAVRDVGRQGVAAVRHGDPELEPQPVHARRAGRAGVHRQDRRDRAVDRRQVLRRDPGDGRGPPRRGLRQVPRHEALGPLPDQRPPEDAARRHHQRQPLGHDLPRHADHGRGPGARRLRHGLPDHARPAAQAAAALRDERRGPPRRLRRAVA